MTSEQKEKKAAINRLNDRLRQIELRFGPDSAPARDYRAKMAKLGGDYVLPSGKISKSKASLDSMSMESIRAMERQKTAGQLISDWRDYIAKVEDTTPDQITEESIIDYYEESKAIREQLEALGDYESDAIRKFRDKYNIKKGKLTYDQLRRARKEWIKQSYRARERYHEKRQEAAKKEAQDTFFGRNSEPVRVGGSRRNEGRRRG